MLALARDVEWEEEKACFRTIAQALAAMYAVQPSLPMSPPPAATVTPPLSHREDESSVAEKTVVPTADVPANPVATPAPPAPPAAAELRPQPSAEPSQDRVQDGAAADQPGSIEPVNNETTACSMADMDDLVEAPGGSARDLLPMPLPRAQATTHESIDLVGHDEDMGGGLTGVGGISAEGDAFPDGTEAAAAGDPTAGPEWTIKHVSGVWPVGGLVVGWPRVKERMASSRIDQTIRPQVRGGLEEIVS